jgi:hypothetical protein
LNIGLSGETSNCRTNQTAEGRRLEFGMLCNRHYLPNYPLIEWAEPKFQASQLCRTSRHVTSPASQCATQLPHLTVHKQKQRFFPLDINGLVRHFEAITAVTMNNTVYRMWSHLMWQIVISIRRKLLHASTR